MRAAVNIIPEATINTINQPVPGQHKAPARELGHNPGVSQQRCHNIVSFGESGFPQWFYHTVSIRLL